MAALAITDHDTVSAIAPARIEAARVGVELVAGVELTAERDGREIHILGHFILDDDPDLVAATAALRLARDQRIIALADRLRALGLSVDLDFLRATYPRATLGRKHLADYLARTGQVASYRAAFDRYLGDGGLAQVPKPRTPWREAIALIRGAGGVAGWAHPPYDLRFETLRALADAGLGAVEVGWAGDHPSGRPALARLGRRPGPRGDGRVRFPCSRPPRPLGRRDHAVAPDLDRLRRLRHPSPSAVEMDHGVQGSV